MERARASTGDITGGGGGGGRAALLVRSYSAGSSSGMDHQPTEQGEVPRREGSWGRVRVARLRRRAAEHRARFYIVRRCLHMLICWRDVDDTKH